VRTKQISLARSPPPPPLTKASVPNNHLSSTQVDFSPARSVALGNEPAAQALRRLAKFEAAMGGGTGATLKLAPQDPRHRFLAYSHAAAAVRACAVPLATPERASPRWLEHHVPFVGAFLARVLADLLRTGSCEQLRGFEADEMVRDSKGELRRDSAGGASRARFCKLPGVGPVRALRWFELGLRSYDDALAATQARAA